MEKFSRNIMYWGENAQTNLATKHVAVFGVGGVGGFCAEMLARSGIGELTIVDFDEVSFSNINRQIIALNSTVGKKKTELFKLRLEDINPQIKLNIVTDFCTENLDNNLFNNVDYVADAIDTMRSKITLLDYCVKNNIAVISSLGAGNRINPEELYVCDISEIKNKKDVFVSNVLYHLKKRGITHGIKVVVSHEKSHCEKKITVNESIKTNSGEQIEFIKITPASTPFVASTAGIIMASRIVRNFIY